jgi:hypothetical protein
MAIVKGHQPDAQSRPAQARDDRGLTGGIERSPGNWLRCGTSAGTTIKSQRATIDLTEDVASFSCSVWSSPLWKRGKLDGSLILGTLDSAEVRMARHCRSAKRTLKPTLPIAMLAS